MSCCGDIVAGAAGLAKAALHIDRADAAIIKARRNACRTCPEASRNPHPRYATNAGLTSLSKCGKCGCFISAKTLLESESCPLEKW